MSRSPETPDGKDVAGRHPDNIPDREGFYNTDILASEVTAGRLLAVQLQGKLALLTRFQGKLYAFSNVCPHAAADLRKGRLFDSQIKCHDHGYTFDIRTGRATWPPMEGCRLMRFTAREEEGFVKVKLAAPYRG